MKITCNCCDGVYDSLDVRITKSCDNKCPFCIDRVCEFEDQGNVDVSILIDKTIKTGISSVLVLGGEPFLNIKKLHAYVMGIRPFVKTIYVTTSLPRLIYLNMPIVDEIIDAIDGLNVSFQSDDWKVNNDIMNASSHHNRYDMLKVLCAKHADKVRASLNLTRQHTNAESIRRFLLNVRSIGVKNVKLNELCHSPENFVSYESLFNVRLKSPYSGGCQTRVHVNGFSDMNIVLKRSCFITEPTLKASVQDLLKAIIRKVFRKLVLTKNRFSVLYEDGSIYNQWQKGGIKDAHENG